MCGERAALVRGAGWEPEEGEMAGVTAMLREGPARAKGQAGLGCAELMFAPVGAQE